jgi:hypothetical protein
LSKTSSPFCSGYFGDRGLRNYLGWPQAVILLIPAFQVARIIGICHQCPARYQSFDTRFHSEMRFLVLDRALIYSLRWLDTK